MILINYSWYQIDDERRVYDDLEVECWNTTHIAYSLIVAAPSIIIWGLGIPLLSIIILYKKKDKLELIDTREKYGFLYNGFKQKYYFWEAINMYRKIAITLISVFLSVYGVITQALVVFLVLIIFLILNIKLLPYAFKSLNEMEMLSILTSMLTIYCGLFFISDMPEVYNSSDSSVREADNGLRLSEGTKLFFFIIIILWNIMFFIYWAKKMYDEASSTFRTKFRKLYLCIWLWGNKYRLEKEIRNRIIKDKNDILQEQFDVYIENIVHLQRNGKLVLDDVNIDKIGWYLKPERYLTQVMHHQELIESQNKSK